MKDPLTPSHGFANLVGYRLETWREDYAELSLEIGEQHLNRSRVLHGGVLTTIIDSAGGYAGCYTADPEKPRRAFTLSLDCQYLGTANVGERILVQAQKTGGGATIFFVKATVVTQDGRLIGQGSATYKYRRSVPPESDRNT